MTFSITIVNRSHKITVKIRNPVLFIDAKLTVFNSLNRVSSNVMVLFPLHRTLVKIQSGVLRLLFGLNVNMKNPKIV